MTRWLLSEVAIEGFRGINNEGDPLVLKLGPDSVNSISAQNAVGKSSIFDSLTYALRGSIPKLDQLQATEKGSEYYLNRFHSKYTGTISLTFVPEGGGKPVSIKVTRDSKGNRTVSGPSGLDANAFLAALDRDFVLLDHKTFQTFIDDKAIDRGRQFSGLLGLARYSGLRQELQALSNTTAFNNHVEAKLLSQKKATLEAQIQRSRTAAQAAFKELTTFALTDQPDQEAAKVRAHEALNQIAVLKAHCTGKTFDKIVIEDCLSAISVAEGGPARARLSELIKQQAEIDAFVANSLADADKDSMRALAVARDAALASTSGDLLHKHYALSKKVLESDVWPDDTICPTCEHQTDHSIHAHIEVKLAHYDAVIAATEAISSEWKTKGWEKLVDLEDSTILDDEPPQFEATDKDIESQALTAEQVDKLWQWRATLVKRSQERLECVKVERLTLEKELPPSLVALTKLVEAARRLQDKWTELDAAGSALKDVVAKQVRNDRVKAFLDQVAAQFAAAEGEASKRRLKAVEPLCQDFFSAIMHQPVTPALVKPATGEGLGLSLSKFWNLEDVSAQALLSESFRNALAVSVYLAAASLYSGTPLFVVLDDITSSFDAGHQFHLMELIRSKFARPGKADGPQVILLSHDTLLEKLFNKNVHQGGWTHQRLEGTARTAVLPQSNAVNRVRDITEKLLNAGRVEDAEPRLRQYLEYKLLEIISGVQIPVPVDFALDDHKKQVQTMLDAIGGAVKLHQAASSLVLEPAQVAALSANVASITGNFLAHYATGSTHAFSAASLLGVLSAIDAYADCFKFEHPAGSGRRQYYRSLSKRS